MPEIAPENEDEGEELSKFHAKTPRLKRGGLCKNLVGRDDTAYAAESWTAASTFSVL